MNFFIAEQLGSMIAYLEYELGEDADNVLTLQKLALASESYRNFSQGDLPGFAEAFALGYAKASRELEPEAPNPSRLDR